MLLPAHVKWVITGNRNWRSVSSLSPWQKHLSQASYKEAWFGSGLQTVAKLYYFGPAPPALVLRLGSAQGGASPGATGHLWGQRWPHILDSLPTGGDCTQQNPLGLVSLCVL